MHVDVHWREGGGDWEKVWKCYCRVWWNAAFPCVFVCVYVAVECGVLLHFRLCVRRCVELIETERKDVYPGTMPTAAWHESVAGTCGGVTALSLWFPLDTIKCRLQTRSTEYDGKASIVLRRMVQQEGFLSLYRGLLSPALGYGAINSTVFTMQNVGTKLMQGENPEKELDVNEKMLVGAFVGFTQTFVRSPIERVKTVMQIRNRDATKAPYSNSISCAYNLVRKEGLKAGLYEGFAPTLCREVPQYTFYFIVYENVRTFLEPHVGTIGSQAIAGGTAGACTWLPPIFCMDVVKTKLQSAPRGMYNGLWDCASKSYKQEGLSVFFRGTSVAMLRAFPLHGTIFVVYESIMKLLRGDE